jgi:hypothetical protein
MRCGSFGRVGSAPSTSGPTNLRRSLVGSPLTASRSASAVRHASGVSRVADRSWHGVRASSSPTPSNHPGEVARPSPGCASGSSSRPDDAGGRASPDARGASRSTCTSKQVSDDGDLLAYSARAEHGPSEDPDHVEPSPVREQGSCQAAGDDRRELDPQGRAEDGSDHRRTEAAAEVGHPRHPCRPGIRRIARNGRRAPEPMRARCTDPPRGDRP